MIKALWIKQYGRVAEVTGGISQSASFILCFLFISSLDIMLLCLFNRRHRSKYCQDPHPNISGPLVTALRSKISAANMPRGDERGNTAAGSHPHPGPSLVSPCWLQAFAASAPWPPAAGSGPVALACYSRVRISSWSVAEPQSQFI